MFRHRIIPFLLSFLAILTGCDIIVPIVLLEVKTKKSNNSPTTALPPDVSYSVYVANFASPATANTEKNNLDSDANGGNPSPATWTLLGQGSTTTTWTTIPANMNAVLVRGPLTQVYNIDTFERLDSNGAVIEVPTSANVYANRNVTAPANASGMLDGVAATTVVTDPAHIPCVFALFTQSVALVRVRIWGPTQAPGDCVWSGHQELANSIVVGGAAADSSGTVYTTYLDTSASPAQSWLLPYAANGTKGSLFNISTLASASGGISVAVDAAGNLFMAWNASSGQIEVQKFSGGTTPAQWTTPYIGVTAGGTNLVGNHGIAVASNISLLSAGPGALGTAVFLAAGQGTTGSHTVARFDDSPNPAPPPPFLGALAWGPFTVADPASQPTTWSGVTVSGSTNVITTGNLSNSGKTEIFTQDRAIGTGSVVWPSSLTTTTGGGASTNNGNSVGADGQGFAYVSGYFGSAANGRDSILLQYKVVDGSGLTTLYHNGVSSGSLTFAGANEFLDVAVDSDGTTYAVGYITQANLVSTTATGSVTSWWIGKFSPSGLVPLWTATFNVGTGSDEALSVSISGNYVYVVGSETVPATSGTKVGLRVLKFVK